MTEIQWTDAEREAVRQLVPLGDLHVYSCRCHGDGDPAATDRSIGDVRGQGVEHLDDVLAMTLPRSSRVGDAVRVVPVVIEDAAREAQAAAKALREFGPWVQQEHACDPEEECPEGTCRLCDLLFAVYADANDRADRIERGESTIERLRAELARWQRAWQDCDRAWAQDRERLAKVEALADRLAQIHNRLHGDVEINRQEHRRGERDLARWLHDDLRAALAGESHGQ